LGILADEVIGETKIPVSAIQGEMPSMGRIKEEYVRGVTKERLIVLNADKLLSDSTIVVHQEVGD
jgi:purine-binding chemotaxis protein CheW